MNQATVHRKIVIEVRNFIGLIHGLMPRIRRVSLIESSVTTMKREQHQRRRSRTAADRGDAAR